MMATNQEELERSKRLMPSLIKQHPSNVASPNRCACANAVVAPTFPLPSSRHWHRCTYVVTLLTSSLLPSLSQQCASNIATPIVAPTLPLSIVAPSPLLHQRGNTNVVATAMSKQCRGIQVKFRRVIYQAIQAKLCRSIQVKFRRVSSVGSIAIVGGPENEFPANFFVFFILAGNSK